ncbi:hypothetical protein BDR06DRAFT_870610, partial [Suillus hirtellus]
TNNTFSLDKVEDFIALKLVVSFKASHKAIQDHNLKWHQFDLTKNTSFYTSISSTNQISTSELSLCSS